MKERQDESRPQSKTTWGTHTSPALRNGPQHVTELLFQWETRHLSPVRRAMVSRWRQSRGTVMAVAAGLTLFVLGAAANTGPGAIVADESLRERLRAAENTLAARQGELELAQLELRRLHSIMEQAQAHRIPADLAESIYDIAVSEGVDPALAFSLVRVESGFAGRAISSAGAVGLTQVMPSTAFWLQPGVTYSELFEPHTNLRLGFRYLRMMLQQYNGDLHLALLAYNRGPGRVDAILNQGGNPANGYSVRVREGVNRPGL